MKIHITMKTPDCVDDAIIEASLNIENEEQRDEAIEDWKELCSRWFEWGECCVIEVDTSEKTCKVLKVG